MSAIACSAAGGHNARVTDTNPNPPSAIRNRVALVTGTLAEPALRRVARDRRVAAEAVSWSTCQKTVLNPRCTPFGVIIALGATLRPARRYPNQ